MTSPSNWLDSITMATSWDSGSWQWPTRHESTKRLQTRRVTISPMDWRLKWSDLRSKLTAVPFGDAQKREASPTLLLL